MSKSKVTSLALLRGIAVLAVCFCHFGKPVADGSVLPKMFQWFSDNGKYGVHIFFVISGFVIPFSLWRAQYSIGDYFPFLYKRLLRLHPPYLVALFLTLIISAASYYSRHLSNPETTITIIKSFFYAHAPADNPVFWTLRIEAEYYIFVGLFFILLNNHKTLALYIGLPIFLALGQSPVADYIGFFNYAIFFFIGMVGFLIYNKDGQPILEWAMLTCLLVFSFYFYEFGGSLAAMITVLFILFFRSPVNPIYEHPGEISYSIYLLHFPIGTKFINLMQRFTNPSYHWVLFILAIIICYGVGWVFWKYIETPAARWSNNIKYGKSKTTFKNFSLKS